MIKRLSSKTCLKKCDNCGKEAIINYYIAMKTRKNSPIYQQLHKDLCCSCTSYYQYRYLGKKSRISEYNKAQRGKTLEERLGNEKAFKCKQKLSEKFSGEKNPMYGDYEHTKGWRRINIEHKGKTDIDFFGKKRAIEISKKRSKAVSGKNNPMYGKPSPKGSGNGWSGWYKGFYFRSILELSFLFDHENVISAENIKISYIDYFGCNRTYHPDYRYNEIIYEMKPKRLIQSPLNKLKFAAAQQYCKQNNLKFVILTEFDITVDYKRIKEKYLAGEIKFLEKYDKKMKELLNQ